jgi:hypothetical protein
LLPQERALVLVAFSNRTGGSDIVDGNYSAAQRATRATDIVSDPRLRRAQNQPLRGLDDATSSVGGALRLR